MLWLKGCPRCGGDLYRRSEEHTSELQSLVNLVCRLLLEKKKTHNEKAKRKKNCWDPTDLYLPQP